MNILFVCHRLPFPPNRGGKIRPFNMIRHLSRNHTVTIASLAHSESELIAGQELKRYCLELIAEVVPTTTRWLRAVRTIPSKWPSSGAYFWSPVLQRRIREFTKRQSIDLVLVHCAFVARYVRHITDAVRILDYGDLDSGKWLDYAQHRGFPLSLGYKLEFHKLRRYETQLAAEFDRFTVTAPGELQEFRKINSTAPCTLITNGVDIEYFAKRPKCQTRDPIIIFLGRMDYFPNVDGITHFVKDIFPLVRARIPNVQLKIVGSNPSPKIVQLQRISGVSVTGFVPDVRPSLAEAAVAVVPLRIARGTQNKMLECMSSGVPVVASPQAGAGVQAVGGRDYLVGSNPQEFASEVIRVLQDPNLQESLSTAARRQVESAHLWSHSMSILDSVIDEAIAAKSSRPPELSRF